MDSQKYTQLNAATIDKWVRSGWEWGRPITHEEYLRAKGGDYQLLLTGSRYVPHSWLPDGVRGKKVLGLASGGAQQMPIFCALGAFCTVLDYSDSQLESERLVAEREGYDINIVKADMTEPLPFPEEEFDLICHPVSNCYIEDVFHVWKECYRVLKKGGLLLAGLDNGINFIIDNNITEPLTVVHRLPYNPLRDRELLSRINIDEEGLQFSHTMEEQIGGQLKAGFVLTDLYEDSNRTGLLHDYNIPQYIATRSLKPL